MSSEKEYDELLFPILCSEGNISAFLDKIFDFLFRRTDFFKVIRNSSTLGLPPGNAEMIVKTAFIKYMDKSVTEGETVKVKCVEEPIIQDYVSEEIVETFVPLESEQSLKSTQRPQRKIKNKGSTTIGKNDKHVNHMMNQKENNDKEIEKKKQLMDPESYNGAKYDGYSWSQSHEELDVLVKVPNEVSTGCQVRAKIQQSHLSMAILEDGVWNTLKDEDLSGKISVEESTWTLVPHEHIHINLQKLQKRWWNALFVDEPKIDTQAIDASIAYEDLAEDERAKIQELMFDQHQKRIGKPTIEQLKIQDALKEAWDVEGSPFKGQPYDPSIINNIKDSGNLF